MRRRPSAVFLDRDGTIIRDPGYVDDPAEVELVRRAAASIARFNARRIPVIVVTNQSGIGRGLYGEREFRAVQSEVERQLAVRGAALDAVFYCPHHPDEGCGCRKPALGMYREAAERQGIDLSRAVYVGDKMKDVLPGVRTGGSGYLVGTGARSSEEDLPPRCTAVRDLWEATERILSGAGSDGAGSDGVGSEASGSEASGRSEEEEEEGE